MSCKLFKVRGVLKRTGVDFLINVDNGCKRERDVSSYLFIFVDDSKISIDEKMGRDCKPTFVERFSLLGICLKNIKFPEHFLLDDCII